MPDGELAIVLHTHMPYVEGFGTWPFGEEWLWEAVATSYLPLLDVLDRAPAASERLTLSLTPVLCDQLEAPGALERCRTFLEQVRPVSHELDIEQLRAGGEHAVAAALEGSAAEYARAAERLRELDDRLLPALAAHARWTSAATHPVLPLLATDSALTMQVQSGIAAHRRRFGDWEGGFWLPECAHAPWLDGLLEEAGVSSTCVELTGLYGLGDERHLRPLQTDEGPVLWPVDRATMQLVWGDRGYPSGPAYRDYHRHTSHHHRAWSNDGEPYDRERALEAVAGDARDFVARAARRVSGGGVCVCALDTELLGHWWYEGVSWLEAAIAEAERQGLALTSLDAALAHAEPAAPGHELPVSSWGEGGDLRTWSGPGVAELAWRARTAELRVAATAAPSRRALRELLALQSSDWAFVITRGLAAPYAHERTAGHADSLARALEPDSESSAELRNLAPDLTGWEG